MWPFSVLFPRNGVELLHEHFLDNVRTFYLDFQSIRESFEAVEMILHVESNAASDDAIRAKIAAALDEWLTVCNVSRSSSVAGSLIPL